MTNNRKNKILRIVYCFIILLIVGLYAFSRQNNQNVEHNSFIGSIDSEITEDFIKISNNCRYTGIEFNNKNILTQRNLLPTSKMELVEYDHQYFILGYSNKHKQAGWCSWILTKYMVRNKLVKRENVFREDTTLKCCMSFNSDYNRSGYDRGHLCPSGDMTWDKKANRETFLLSNICPQNKNLNQGRWNDLEVLSRAWASKNDSLLIIAGPIFEPNKGTIGKGKVTVPSAFYKILIDISSPKCKAIAFIMPNEPIKNRLFTYATTIKEVEKRTNLNFFPKYDNNKLIQQLENLCDTSMWK